MQALFVKYFQKAKKRQKEQKNAESLRPFATTNARDPTDFQQKHNIYNSSKISSMHATSLIAGGMYTISPP